MLSNSLCCAVLSTTGQKCRHHEGLVGVWGRVHVPAMCMCSSLKSEHARPLPNDKLQTLYLAKACFFGLGHPLNGALAPPLDLDTLLNGGRSLKKNPGAMRDARMEGKE